MGEVKAQAPRVLIVLHSINIILRKAPIEEDIISHIWTRMWPWILFQNRFMLVLALDDAVDVDLPVELCSLHLSLLRRLALTDDSQIRIVVGDQAHDVRMLVLRLWQRFVHDKRLRDAVTGDDLGALLLGLLPISKSMDLTEIIDGVGGHLLDLGSLVIKHLSLITSTTHGPFPLPTIFVLLKIIDNDDFSVVETFLDQGLVKQLVALLVTIQRVPSINEAFPFHDVTCSTLLRCLRSHSGRLATISAVKSGLLLALIGCALRGHEEDPVMDIITSLLSILTEHLCYHSFLKCVERELPRLERLRLPLDTARSPFWHELSQFRQVARQRVRLKAEFADTPSMIKFCDNIECKIWVYRRDSLRCTGCQSRYHCSVGCQKEDWEHGLSHKFFCPHLEPKGGSGLPTRDKSFLRHLLHSDYLWNKLRILTLQTEHRLAGVSTDYFTEFDYRYTPVRISIHKMDALINVLPHPRKMLAVELLERMRWSHGRFHIHRAVVPDGAEAAYWSFGLRTTSTKLYDGLQELVLSRGEGRMGGDAYISILRDLISADETDEDLVELHSY
ncbi:hypothetical protein C8R43DRAFT_1119032 [Mycena crocata]|nr:hypothetical protein C8R43DRAFT_1119032 [Mycena crocata]